MKDGGKKTKGRGENKLIARVSKGGVNYVSLLGVVSSKNNK